MNSLKQSAKIDEVKKWLNEIVYDGAYGMMKVEQDSGWQNNEYIYSVYIHTVLNKYSIRAVDRLDQPGYLGCTATGRYSRPGEDWLRGNDLPDGVLEYETWKRIKQAMLVYEFVRHEPCHSVVAILYPLLKQLPVEMLPELLIAEDSYVRAAAKRRVELETKQ